MSQGNTRMLSLTGLLLLGAATVVIADPCGMVPPVYVGTGVPITRVGDQQTYVFFKDGIETCVIRPGFTGKVDEFGMLIPFPSVPEIRKVADNIFPHVAAAVDPPEVVIDLRIRFLRRSARFKGAPQASAVADDSLAFKKDEVRVVKQEAVGMYEVAVLEAGSAAALKRWIDDHGFVYPKGMDAACEDYVAEGWCFVAVKTKVAQKDGVDPKPGMRKVNPKLPAGSAFDGHVQAMGFRFRVKELVVPMRLSTFNEGDLHNIVYLLSDQPQKIRSVPEEYVVRQIPGKQLFKNLTRPLPLRIIGGTAKQIPQFQRQNLKQRRDPIPHNGSARDLFAADLLAVKEKRLTHPHEESEKMLLRIGERLGLRGPAIDVLNLDSLKTERDATVKQALADLDGMTLTIIDGSFPREVLAKQNLAFAPYKMPARRNRPEVYDAIKKGPGPKKEGTVVYGAVSFAEPAGWPGLERPTGAKPRSATAGASLRSSPGHPAGWKLSGFATFTSFLGIGLVFAVRRRGGSKTATLLLVAGVTVGVFGLVAQASSAEKDATEKVSEKEIIRLIDQLSDPKKADEAAGKLIKLGKPAVPHLLGEAYEGNVMSLRGWAIVCLAEIGGPDSKKQLTQIQDDKQQPKLVRTWAAAGRVKMAKSTEELLQLATLIPQLPALGRPLGMRLVADLTKKGNEVSAEDLLNVTLTVPQLQQPLAAAILASGRDSLIKAMVTAKNQNVRRQAAAYLGTLTNQGDKAVGSAVAETYKFDPKAKQVVWNGGPLFIPGIKWSKKDSRALVGNLVAWHLWCERKNQKANQQQIHNNLRSLQLAAAAGYQSPGFRNVTTDQWLLAWGRAVGKQEIKRMLTEQGVADEVRYQKVLNQLD